MRDFQKFATTGNVEDINKVTKKKIVFVIVLISFVLEQPFTFFVENSLLNFIVKVYNNAVFQNFDFLY